MSMQAIGGCGGVGASGGVSGANRPDPEQMRKHMEKMMEPVAEALGLSATDLRSALQQGQSLSEIADSKGVSRDDLLAAVKEGLQANRPQGAPELSATQLDNLAIRIADRSHSHDTRPNSPPEGESTTTSSTDAQMLLLQLLSKSDDSQDSMAASSGFNGLL